MKFEHLPTYLAETPDEALLETYRETFESYDYQTAYDHLTRNTLALYDAICDLIVPESFKEQVKSEVDRRLALIYQANHLFLF